MDRLLIKEAAAAELAYLRQLGTNDDLILVTANPGAYEAVLYLLSGSAEGTPVYEAVSNVQSRYSTQSGVISRLRAMRKLGLIEERPGAKKSQVCLAPSDKLLANLGSVLLQRCR
jgi:hypothetical protein